MVGVERLFHKRVLHPGIGSVNHSLKSRGAELAVMTTTERSMEGDTVMTKIQDKLTTFWRDAINLVLGIWLIVSPLALEYAAQATPAWNAYVVGVIIAVLSAAALWQFQKWEEWLSAVVGAWLIVSPWILGFGVGHAATWNQVIVGIVVGVLAFWSSVTEHNLRELSPKH
jgi:hypothetical protein